MMQTEPLSAFLKCLKQIGTTAPQEYTSLTRNYKDAQTHILSLQRSLMEETLCNQRQRSLLEVLKQALNEEMDDLSILSFLRSLNQELSQDPDLAQVMGEVQEILGKRQRKSGESRERMMIQMSVRVEELQNQLECWASKAQCFQRDLEGERANNRERTQQIQRKSSQYHSDSQALRTQVSESSIANQELVGQVARLSLELQQFSNQNQILRQNVQDTRQTILQLQSNWKQSDSCLKQCQQQLKLHQVLVQQLQRLLGVDKQGIKPLLTKLVKNYKFLKLRVSALKQDKENSFANSLKQFLSQQALNLVTQIQQNTSMQCLYKQLEELCCLQKRQLLHYKSQQRELRKCRMELLRSQETGPSTRTREFSTRRKLKDFELTGRLDQTSEFKL